MRQIISLLIIPNNIKFVMRPFVFIYQFNQSIIYFHL